MSDGKQSPAATLVARLAAIKAEAAKEARELADVERNIRLLRARRRVLREMAAARSAAVGEIGLCLKAMEGEK